MAENATPAAAPAGQGDIEYGSFYYRHDCGIPYERNEHWLKFFGEVAEGIIHNLHPSSVLDAGCAMGFLVEALHKRGVEAWGVDISEYAISKVDESVRDRCSVASLTEPLLRRYDLIVCVEVLEHISPTDTDKVIANLCAATDRLIISTSPEDYGEATHLNVQPPEAWSAALAREGFLRDLEQDLYFLTPWAAVYSRRQEPLAETVRSYDRSWWRLRHEVTDVRRALLAAQDQLGELERAKEEIEGKLPSPTEIERRDEEILRLRDLMIGKDSELGAARGQLTALEDQSERLANIAGRIQARIPIAMRLVDLLRRLRALGRG
jgi:SAM-dependent methyltransferase